MPEPSTSWRLNGHEVYVSSLDKLYWPDDGLTKGDLLAYYRDVAPIMLPYLEGRPLTLRVYPEGIHGSSYYRRDVPEGAPPWIGQVDYSRQSGGRTIQMPLVENAAGLVWLANQGCIEFHPWSSRLPDLDHPDQAVFDLDPGDEASYDDVLQAALWLREELERDGLRGYPKTSGKHGLHVHVPLAPGHAYDDVRLWVKSVAERLAESHPEQIAVASGATHRGDQISIDYAQNSIARTMAAPYTARAAAGAPVAAPLTWEEIAAGQVRSSDFTIRTMPERLKSVGDLFAPVLNDDQSLPSA